MGTITLVPTPIGNLEDITLRALRYLKESDKIAAEDTRVTRNLLNHFNITVPLISLHSYNEHALVNRLIEQVQTENWKLSVVSDAGTPGISDPGFLLVREALKAGLEIETLPGPTAFVPALINSGLPCDRFVFEGFLPVKKGRQTRLKQLQPETRTIILYESPHRLLKTLEELSGICGEDRLVSVSKEISKKFEKHFRGSLAEVKSALQGTVPKGEWVIIVGGNEK
jgi:16S rRNA (cytidine1402-2'-O)-methyltransferase